MLVSPVVAADADSHAIAIVADNALVTGRYSTEIP